MELDSFFQSKQVNDSGNVVRISGGKFRVDPADVDVMFRILEQSLFIKYKHSYAELQTGQEASGIDLDFDVYTTNEISVTDKKYEMSKLIQNFIEIFAQTIKPGEYVVHAHVLSKAIRKIKTKEGVECNKDSFRVRIPDVWITTPHKKYLMRKLTEGADYAKWVRSLRLISDAHPPLDMSSATHPKLFLGGARSPELDPHLLAYSYEIRISGENVDIFDFSISDIGKYEAPKKGASLAYVPGKYNLVRELSLTFPGILHKKIAYECIDTLRNELQIQKSLANENEEIKLIYYKGLDDVVRGLDTQGLDDPMIKTYKCMLDCIDPKIASEFESWKKVIMHLAYINLDYKLLAYYFSMRAPEYFTSQAKATDCAIKIDELWLFATNNRLEEDQAIISENCIRKLAREGNLAKYNEINRDNVVQKVLNIIKAAKCDADPFNSWNLADVIKSALSEYIFTDSIEDTTYWFVFMMDKNEVKDCPFEIYKYVRMKRSPKMVIRYIAETLPVIIDAALNLYDRAFQNIDPSDSTLKFKKKLVRNIQRRAISLGDRRVYEGIADSLASMLMKRQLSLKLDAEPGYIGVIDGVYDLTRNRLLTGLHGILISRYTKLRAIEYDAEKNERIKEVLGMLRDIFAGNEETLTFIMCYLASSLDGRPKKPIYMIWPGFGSNGKSIILKFMTAILGFTNDHGYSTVVSISRFIKPKDGRVTKAEGSGPDTEGASMRDARLIYSTESNPGDCLHATNIKRYTSDDVSNNDKFEKQKMFRIHGNFIFATNHELKCEDLDHGIWRRLMRLVFKVLFIEDPDPNDPYQKKLDPRIESEWVRDPAYQEAFFAILLHHYRIYADKYGYDLMAIPHSEITSDTIEYQNTQNQYLCFKNTYIEKAADVETTLDDMTLAYIEFASTKVSIPRKDKNEIQSMLKKLFRNREVFTRDGVEYIKGWRKKGAGDAGFVLNTDAK